MIATKFDKWLQLSSKADSQNPTQVPPNSVVSQGMHRIMDYLKDEEVVPTFPQLPGHWWLAHVTFRVTYQLDFPARRGRVTSPRDMPA